MAKISVLFVDDEEDIRLSFRDRFEEQFEVALASNGQEALEHLAGPDATAVVVTDLRMPRMGGLDMIARAKDLDPDLGFIVVSGHGDTDDVIAALRLGARNFLRKPYAFAELEEAIMLEARRYRLIQDERKRRKVEQATEQFLVGVEGMTFLLPSSLDWVNPLTFRLVGVMEAVGICDEQNRSNVALALMEVITNAIEHGNLAMNGAIKREMMAAGEQAYAQELALRASQEPYRGRRVRVSASVDADRATITVEDEGAGFDFHHLPDPTDPENLFLPNGRGILLARSFIDEVQYGERGNVCTLVQYRRSGR
ncbi:MAG TPA: response regulator [bacterium]|jgi:FixJ family two-component response regulator/anti-sigma regulatory factor (Ser/Thr protein kinase)